ncbi:hypothetical protein HK104_006750 [Borealophlyctis nickersoniae]|nr:hypothetical protein HK104_006750 [Borealophlyctis nickersoniae]
MPVDVVQREGVPPGDEELQQQLKSIRKELKEWEKEFAAREGRKPGTDDIKQDKEIARRYKAYMKLKSAAEGKPVKRKSTRTKGGDQSDDEGREESGVPEEDTAEAGGSAAPAAFASSPPPKSRPSSSAGRKSKSRTPEEGFMKKERSDNQIVRGDVLGDEAPPEYAVEVKPRNSVTIQVASATDGSKDGEGARPWGTGYVLPENFKLRKDTIAAGPLPTAKLTESVRPGSASRRSTVGDTGRPTGLTAAVTASLSTADATRTEVEPFRPAPQSSEFQDFVNRRKQLETISTKPPPGAVTAADALRAAASSPTSSAPVAAPVVVTPVTFLSSPASTSPPVNLSTTARPLSPTSPVTTTQRAPPTAQELRELARPYDPAEHDAAAKPTVTTVDVIHPTFQSSPSTPSSSSRPTSGGRISSGGAATPTGWTEDDEKEENAALAVSPMSPATAKASGAAAFDVPGINSGGKPVDVVLTARIFFRLPKDGILRCRLYRKKNILDKSHPTFYLHNESDDALLLAARKRKKSKTVNYLISTSPDDMSKDSKHYVGKLKANFQRTNFILYDARSYNKNSNNKGLRELACMSYSKTVLPREMSVAIPATHIEELSDDLSKDIMADVKTQNASKLVFLRNKPPRWNEATQSHCLNFGGRVTQPSIKNFQLVGDGDEGYIVMQFGRCGADCFSLDARYPMTPIEAFAVAISSFDAYDSA